MHERCPVCALGFQREPGYFVGAMYIGYALMLLPAGLTYLAIWYFTGWSANKIMLCTFIAYLPLVPPVIRWARVLWLYFDQSIDPDSVA
jgi:hypothetical protein